MSAKGRIKKMDALDYAPSAIHFLLISPGMRISKICTINADTDVSGILLLRPLPKQICEKDIEAMIDPKKDLDGISQ